MNEHLPSLGLLLSPPAVLTRRGQVESAFISLLLSGNIARLPHKNAARQAEVTTLPSIPRTPLPPSPCPTRRCPPAFDQPLPHARPPPPPTRSAVPLSRSPLQSSADPRLAEAYLEAALRAAVEHHRRGLLGAGGATAWDEGLAHLLMPALDAYEHVGAVLLVYWGFWGVELVAKGDGGAGRSGEEKGSRALWGLAIGC